MSEPLKLKQQLCSFCKRSKKKKIATTLNNVFKNTNETYPQFLVFTIFGGITCQCQKSRYRDWRSIMVHIPLIKRMEQVDLIKRERYEEIRS